MDKALEHALGVALQKIDEARSVIQLAVLGDESDLATRVDDEIVGDLIDVQGRIEKALFGSDSNS